MVQTDSYVGKQIGNYYIEQEIASGSYGTVYLARHLHLKQRTVVIKILHSMHLGSEEEKEQFLQEAEILETLKGLPNILPLLDVGIDGNVPYMIAEYEEQGSLRTYMRRHGVPLPLQEVLTIIGQVGLGLQNAHDQGIAHCDLKPENILFNARGEALLADFSISTVLSTSSVVHREVVGTPGYMAPEQFQGEVSKESDQYGLACITYELLTGRKPFQAPDFVSMGFQHTTRAPIPPGQLNPQIPASVEAALLRALAKDRSERFPSISAFVAALNNQTLQGTSLDGQGSWDNFPFVSGQSISPSTLPEADDPGTFLLATSSNPISLPSTFAGASAQPFYSSTLNEATTVAAYNPIAGGALPPTYPGRPQAPWSPPPSRTGNNRPIVVIALVVLVLLVLGFAAWGVIAAAMQGTNNTHGNVTSTSPATITITPASQTVQDTITMQGVTSNANADNHQITVRSLTSTKSATDTINATGSGQAAGVAATGMLSFTNTSNTTHDVAAGTTFKVSNTVNVITDAPVTIPAKGLFPGQIQVNAHASPNGTAGNIQDGALKQTCCTNPNDGSVTVTNSAFSGGQDGQKYTFLQQSDEDGVANAHQDTLKADAQNDIKNQLTSGEQQLGDMKCDTKTTADAQTGDNGLNNAVTTAHVTVTESCSATAYNPNDVQTIAQNDLQQKVSKDQTLGPGYALAGKVVTQSQSPQSQQQNQPITFQVTASGVWYYKWTDPTRQDLLNQIKGKSKTQAQAILNSYQGVGNAKIDISNGGDTLSSDVNQITLDVKTVNGLS